jgi:hypothetical protein
MLPPSSLYCNRHHLLFIFGYVVNGVVGLAVRCVASRRGYTMPYAILTALNLLIHPMEFSWTLF